MTRVVIFILVVALIAGGVYWLMSAKARRAAAAINHKHEMGEIKTDKIIEGYKKDEKKARK